MDASRWRNWRRHCSEAPKLATDQSDYRVGESCVEEACRGI